MVVRVGLKGSDGVVELAIARGVEPSAGLRASEMLGALDDPVPGQQQRQESEPEQTARRNNSPFR